MKLLITVIIGSLAVASTHALDLLPSSSPVRLAVSGTLDTELYVSDSPTPGLLFSNDDVFFNPRLTLNADLQMGDHFSAFVQGRFDRGFDPGTVEDGEARLDEYAVRWSPFDEPVLNLQAGKFATVFGTWVSRHLSWDNPFITAPVPYESVLGITDLSTAPSRAAFLDRKRVPDKKREWVPVIWGPSYAHGASLFGRVEKFDYALEIKSSALSSRPGQWEADQVDWGAPTYTGRFGYRPNASWNFGASFSTGAYLSDEADITLPRGTSRDDFNQETLGFDFSYAHGHFELWGEAIFSRFEVPRVGDADTAAYFLEAKYKLTSSLYTALRWNQQFFDDVSDGTGGSEGWDRDLFRVDMSLGYRFTRHLQTKIQYSYGHERGPGANADHLLAAQMTVKF